MTRWSSEAFWSGGGILEHEYLVFSIDNRQCAIDLALVERVTPMVTLIPFSGAASPVVGLTNYNGDLLPTVSLRWWWEFPPPFVASQDFLLVIKHSKQLLVLVVDKVIGVVPIAQDTQLEAHPEGPEWLQHTKIMTNRNTTVYLPDLHRLFQTVQAMNLKNQFLC